MKKIDLVFRTINERTADISLQLAIKNIQPQKVHLIDNVQPFTKAVEEMLNINYEADFVVFVDADCLILEDLRPFLETNNLPYIDCYVVDKFRGKIHTGVHITRIDLVNEMKNMEVPQNDLKYVLRPESRIRALALKKLKQGKAFRNFKILHDFFQDNKNIFMKYALRELRSRTDTQKVKLQFNMNLWNAADNDYQLAKAAVEFAQNAVPINASAMETNRFIENLPALADNFLKEKNIQPKEKLEWKEVETFIESNDFHNIFDNSTQSKIFGIGLSRTATKSLTKALNQLGYCIIHYPTDITTFQELISGNYNFSLLNFFDGITDITVAPFYAQLDKIFPNSKFILTIREKEKWLESIKNHWEGKSLENNNEETHKIELRKFLRATTYGTLHFAKERLEYVFDNHRKNIEEYFKNEPEKLLIMNISEGDGWEKLCNFLNLPLIENEDFPYAKKSFNLQ